MPLRTTAELEHLRTLQTIIGVSPVMLIIWEIVPGQWPVRMVTDNLPALFGYKVSELTGGAVSWTAITHPADVDRLEAEVRQHLEQGTPAWTQEYRIRCRSGDYRWIRDWNHPVRDAKTGARYIQALMVDITEQKAAEARLHRTHRSLRILTEGNRILNRSVNENRLLSTLCRVVGEAGEYPMVWLAYARQDACRSLHPKAGFGHPKSTVFPRSSLTWADTRQGNHPGGQSVRTGKPSICRDAATNPLCTAWRATIRKLDLRSIAGFPLLNPDGPLGTLVLGTTGADAFTHQEIRVLQQLANDIGFGIDTLRGRLMRATLERQLLEAAEQEQRRLGHDLHDSVGQSLSAILYLVGAVQQTLGDRLPAIGTDLARIATLVGETAHQVHDLSQGLFPGDLRHGGIVPALQSLAMQTQDVFGIDCRYSGLDGRVLSDADTTLQLYRIACEAVTNAAKHSRCRTIRIRLARRRERIVLTVRDNGQGFPCTPETPATGRGLHIMHYRAERIGARLLISSHPGKGTAITCSLAPDAPVRPQPERRHARTLPNGNLAQTGIDRR